MLPWGTEARKCFELSTREHKVKTETESRNRHAKGPAYNPTFPLLEQSNFVPIVIETGIICQYLGEHPKCLFIMLKL